MNEGAIDQDKFFQKEIPGMKSDLRKLKKIPRECQEKYCEAKKAKIKKKLDEIKDKIDKVEPLLEGWSEDVIRDVNDIKDQQKRSDAKVKAMIANRRIESFWGLCDMYYSAKDSFYFGKIDLSEEESFDDKFKYGKAKSFMNAKIFIENHKSDFEDTPLKDHLAKIMMINYYTGVSSLIEADFVDTEAYEVFKNNMDDLVKIAKIDSLMCIKIVHAGSSGYQDASFLFDFYKHDRNKFMEALVEFEEKHGLSIDSSVSFMEKKFKEVAPYFKITEEANKLIAEQEKTEQDQEEKERQHAQKVEKYHAHLASEREVSRDALNQGSDTFKMIQIMGKDYISLNIKVQESQRSIVTELKKLEGMKDFNKEQIDQIIRGEGDFLVPLESAAKVKTILEKNSKITLGANERQTLGNLEKRFNSLVSLLPDLEQNERNHVLENLDKFADLLNALKGQREVIPRWKDYDIATDTSHDLGQDFRENFFEEYFANNQNDKNKMKNLLKSADRKKLDEVIFLFYTLGKRRIGENPYLITNDQYREKFIKISKKHKEVLKFIFDNPEAKKVFINFDDRQELMKVLNNESLGQEMMKEVKKTVKKVSNMQKIVENTKFNQFAANFSIIKNFDSSNANFSIKINNTEPAVGSVKESYKGILQYFLYQFSCKQMDSKKDSVSDLKLDNLKIAINSAPNLVETKTIKFEARYLDEDNKIYFATYNYYYTDKDKDEKQPTVMDMQNIATCLQLMASLSSPGNAKTQEYLEGYDRFCLLYAERKGKADEKKSYLSPEELFSTLPFFDSEGEFYPDIVSKDHSDSYASLVSNKLKEFFKKQANEKAISHPAKYEKCRISTMHIEFDKDNKKIIFSLGISGVTSDQCGIMRIEAPLLVINDSIGSRNNAKTIYRVSHAVITNINNTKVRDEDEEK